jgi:hypothetical protein
MMKHLKLIGLMAMALFAIAAALASSASAVTLENLPEKARSTPGKSIGAVIYETAILKLECSSAVSTGEETVSKPPSGSFHIEFKGCKAASVIGEPTCTGLGDATSGTILALGTWKLVFDKNPATEELRTALLLESAEVHLTCAGFVLVSVSAGETLCLHINPTVKGKSHEFKCKQSKGTPEETKWWSGAGVEHIGFTPLKQTVNGSTEPAAWLGTGLVETTEEIFADQ